MATSDSLHISANAKISFEKSDFSNLELKISTIANGREWVVKTRDESSLSVLDNVINLVKNLFGKLTQSNVDAVTYKGADFESLLKEVAAGKKIAPMELKQMTRSNAAIMNDSSVRTSKEVLREKFQRAGHAAAKIGKGLVALEKQGIKGGVLHTDYWQEALQEEHSYSGQGGWVQGFYKQWTKENSNLSFKEWLQTDRIQARLQNMQKQDPTVAAMKVDYLTTEERAAFKVSFQSGALMQSGKPLATGSFNHERAIFVLDKDRNLYAGDHEAGKFHHSSFLSGAATIGAGEIQTNEQGKVVLISTKTGHYRPADEVGENPEESRISNAQSVLRNIRVLRFFEKNGIDLNTVIFEQRLASGETIRSTGAEYLKSKGNFQ